MPLQSEKHDKSALDEITNLAYVGQDRSFIDIKIELDEKGKVISANVIEAKDFYGNDIKELTDLDEKYSKRLANHLLSQYRNQVMLMDESNEVVIGPIGEPASPKDLSFVEAYKKSIASNKPKEELEGQRGDFTFYVNDGEALVIDNEKEEVIVAINSEGRDARNEFKNANIADLNEKLKINYADFTSEHDGNPPMKKLQEMREASIGAKNSVLGLIKATTEMNALKNKPSNFLAEVAKKEAGSKVEDLGNDTLGEYNIKIPKHTPSPSESSTTRRKLKPQNT